MPTLQVATPARLSSRYAVTMVHDESQRIRSIAFSAVRRGLRSHDLEDALGRIAKAFDACAVSLASMSLSDAHLRYMLSAGEMRFEALDAT